MQTSNIKVAVRVRPLLESEKQRGLLKSQTLSIQDTTSVLVTKHQNEKAYKFDQVFESSCDQETVYKRLRMDYLLKQVVAGFHATVFVYGQTGSGKTYTMDGYKYETSSHQVVKPVLQTDSSQEGLIPRAIKNLFESVSQRKSQQPQSRITVYIQYIQLYNEKIYDLLNKQSQRKLHQGKDTGLKLKWNMATDEVTVENVFKYQCETAEDALAWFFKGLKNKIMAAHQMNSQSSRSHCILTFTVSQYSAESETMQVVSKLQLVDLAGSERQAHTQQSETTNQAMLKEAIEINKSLFTLRQVIAALTENSQKAQKAQPLNYVPYRESKLTTLLRQSLGGNSYCLMIACIAPLDLYTEENISTLNYAARASQISNAPSVNTDPRLKQIAEQKQQIAKLQADLRRANETIKYLTQGGCVCKLDTTQGSQLKEVISPAKQQLSITQNLLATPTTSLNSAAVRLPSLTTVQQQETPQTDTDQFSLSQSQFSALQSKFRKTTGLVSQNQSASYNQDRLISSISVIKEVLQSNMTLRDDLLKLSQDNDHLNQTNYQLKIENEDLRDRLNLLGIEKPSSVNIEYMPYIAAGSVEKLCDNTTTAQQLRDAKIVIFNHIFSLQKENRALVRRLKSTAGGATSAAKVTSEITDLNRSQVVERRPSSYQIAPHQSQLRTIDTGDNEEPAQSKIKVMLPPQHQMVVARSQRLSQALAPQISADFGQMKPKRPPLKPRYTINAPHTQRDAEQLSQRQGSVQLQDSDEQQSQRRRAPKFAGGSSNLQHYKSKKF